MLKERGGKPSHAYSPPQNYDSGGGGGDGGGGGGDGGCGGGGC